MVDTSSDQTPIFCCCNDDLCNENIVFTNPERVNMSGRFSRFDGVLRVQFKDIRFCVCMSNVHVHVYTSVWIF